MTTNNSSNNQFDNNSDGFDLSGGTTSRKLTVTGADVTLTGSGDNVYTMPAASGTLITLEDVYPVGAIYMSASVSTSPATVLGFGTWTAIGGYTLVGYKTGDTNFGALGAVAAGEVTHTLTTDEMPSHNHTSLLWNSSPVSLNSGAGSGYHLTWGSDSNNDSSSFNNGDTGGSAAHNNIQPSFVVYIWYRSA